MLASMRLPALLVLTAFLTTKGSSQQRSWRLGDDQPFNTPIAKLPAAERMVIIRAVDATFKNPGWEAMSPQELQEANRNLKVQNVDMGGRTFQFVQGWGSVLCGAVGNCPIWVFDQAHRVLLSDGGNRIVVLKSLDHDLPLMYIYSHWSASELGRTLDRYDGRQYRQVACATIEFGPIETYRHPQTTQVSCKTWE